MVIYDIIRERMDPDELVDVLELTTSELVDLLRDCIDDKEAIFKEIFNID